ncbi:hypothetical protein L207DRAFT_611872 [Hyaloscypha variabilis F]|uniref:NAD(P)-binding protein n=1 Tax=Hyaloscypha variabilis (strain UAMH 11265 / GT02V1 / F) TaxID=1149755 RepID=A0A2J6QXT4_HYAVF|nr:hypothetical protein L207DRAFT_611872 [Hyaloscypha variabilis F]
MVQLSTVRACNADLVKNHHITAVFVGGTSGIGEYTMRALASTVGTSGRGIRAYIVSRNQKAADAIIADCRKVSKDLSLIQDVDRVCQDITSMEEARKPDGGTACIDLLVLTQAWFAFGGKLERIETSEGLIMSFSLLYYSRMRFIVQLLPLLAASPLQGRVVSVFAPGNEAKLFTDDLALRKPENFGFANFNSHTAFMTTLFFEKLAAANQGKLSLSHCFPGIVETPALTGNGVPSWFKGIWAVATPLVKAISTNPKECGDRLLFTISPRFPARSSDTKKDIKTPGKGEKLEVATSSDGVLGGGCYRNNAKSESVPLGKPYKSIRLNEVREKVWDHTMNVFENISTKGHYFG